MKVHRDLSQLPHFTKSVITIGSFDGLHLGHKKILDRIKDYSKQYQAPSVVITFDPHPREIIYPSDHTLELITSLKEKIILFEKAGIEHLVVVPFTVEFAQLNPREYLEKFLIGKFNPYCIVIGYDHRFGLNRGGDIHLLREYGEKYKFNVIQIPKQECDHISISSTKIRNAVKNRQIEVANRLLGHPYFFIGEVIHGKKVGQRMGFPTANLKIRDKKKLLPPPGIYAVLIYHGSDKYRGMMYVGSRPTLEKSGEEQIEVHLFNFNQYIYGDTLLVELIDFIRNDVKYDNLEELKEGLKADKISALDILINYEEKSKRKVSFRGAIALLNYNGMKHLPTFLPTVVEHCPPDCRIYLIDNFSKDGSVEWTREHYPQIEVIELLDNTGYAGGYNLGLQLIREKYLALVNTDVAFDSQWITKAMDFMDGDEEVACVQPKVKSYLHPDHFEHAGACGGFLDILSFPFCRGRIVDMVEEDEGQYDEPMEVFWASGAAMVVKRELFEKAGGFDELYFAHMEEIDLCWRLKKAGYKLYCLPQLQVFHLGGGTLSYDHPHKTYLNFRNNLFTILKNESKRRLVWVVPARITMDIGASFHFLLQGKFQLFKMVWKAHLDVLLNLPQLTMSRRKFNKKVADLKFQSSRTRFGRYYYPIVWQYFINGKKKFSELKWTQHEATKH
nr:bifunctional riboflavin kinase/FAD synthetase [Saprospiraceae bacterium]